MHRHTEPDAGPSGSATVVLELGPGVGVLVLHTPAGMNGAEIEISLTGSDGPRTHSMVRPRHVPGGTRYAAVYPGLAAGEYQIWAPGGPAVATVTITAGIAATAHWPLPSAG
jgi:hypothetical protein